MQVVAKGGFMRIWLLALGLCLAQGAIAFNESLNQESEVAWRVPDECGCEGGSLYLYSVSHDGLVSKVLLASYSSPEACHENRPRFSVCQ